jgi:superfamily II DNA or RNA helicase
MEIDDNIICIAMSRIFAVGINIKNLHYVIFAQGGKAKVTLIQSIGRGLRLHDQKECLVIIDIADTTHYGEKHLIERLTYYKEEQIEYETKELFG